MTDDEEDDEDKGKERRGRESNMSDEQQLQSRLAPKQ
jgi:hypothetical protein